MGIRYIEAAEQQSQLEIKLWSQTHAQAFYQKHGVNAHGEEFLDAGIPHIKMTLIIKKHCRRN